VNVTDVRAEERLLTVRQAGEIIGASYATTKRLIASGDLRSVKRGRRRLVPLSATQDHIRRLVVNAA